MLFAVNVVALPVNFCCNRFFVLFISILRSSLRTIRLKLQLTPIEAV